MSNRFKKLWLLVSGPHSKTTMRTEQSELTRTLVRSIEVTVETEEMVVYQSGRVARTYDVSIVTVGKTDE